MSKNLSSAAVVIGALRVNIGFYMKIWNHVKCQKHDHTSRVRCKKVLSAVLVYFTFILFSDSKFDSLRPVASGAFIS